MTEIPQPPSVQSRNEWKTIPLNVQAVVLGLKRRSGLDIGNGALECAGQVDMEQRFVQPVYHSHFGGALGVRLATNQLLVKIGVGGVNTLVRDIFAFQGRLAKPRLLSVARLLAAQFLFILTALGHFGCAGAATDFSNAEDWLPPFKAGFAVRRRRVSKTSRGQSTFGPPIVDAGEMPVNTAGSRVLVELVANIDEMLHRCNIDIVHG